MPSDKPKPLHEIHEDEHDDDTPYAKRVLGYGWDSDALIKRRLKVDADGKLEISGVEIEIRDEFQTNDIEEASATVTYIGMEDASGEWYLKKIDTSSDTVFSHATELNNVGTSDYSTAWTGRAGLTYQDYSNAF